MINLPSSIWFFDIDDTLIDTAGGSKSAAQGIAQTFATHFPSHLADKVAHEFNTIFDLMLTGYRIKDPSEWRNTKYSKRDFDALLSYIENCQKFVQEKFGTYKKWSREVFIKYAADKLQLQVTPELIHEAADAYWMTLTAKTKVFPGALKLFKHLHEHKRPVYLITSSDARLKMHADGQFEYIPEYSEGLKRERIELLRTKGLEFRLVSIGDPEDKPEVGFFNKGVDKAATDLGRDKLDCTNCVMIGDSFAGDLQTPLVQMNFGLVVLFKKGQDDLVKEGERFYSTGDLNQVLELLT